MLLLQGAVSRLTQAKAEGEREKLKAQAEYEAQKENFRACLARIQQLEDALQEAGLPVPSPSSADGTGCNEYYGAVKEGPETSPAACWSANGATTHSVSAESRSGPLSRRHSSTSRSSAASSRPPADMYAGTY